MAEFEVMSNAEYRKREGLSSSDIKQMMKSFAYWKYFVDHPEEDTDTPALKFGRAYHKFMLEPYDFENEFKVVPVFNCSSKEGKAEYISYVEEMIGRELTDAEKKYKDSITAALYAESKVEFVDEETIEKLTAMREVLYKTPYVKKLIAGEHEKSFFWMDETTGIKCKCRPDSYGEFGSQPIIVDLKTTQDAETSAFMKSALKFNYDVQAAHYTAGLEKIFDKQYSFIFIAQETKAPYLVNILQADDYFMQNGREVRKVMLETYKKCLELNEYPAYMGFAEDKHFINQLSVPAWIKNAIESEADFVGEDGDIE